ncbi:MAG: DNA-directed RNA polymerase [Desulfobulbus sp.]
MDAAHFALTVTAYAKEGITDFMMIHDSFGCRASDMPKMNRILREEFIKSMIRMS